MGDLVYPKQPTTLYVPDPEAVDRLRKRNQQADARIKPLEQLRPRLQAVPPLKVAQLKTLASKIDKEQIVELADDALKLNNGDEKQGMKMLRSQLEHVQHTGSTDVWGLLVGPLPTPIGSVSGVTVVGGLDGPHGPDGFAVSVTPAPRKKVGMPSKKTRFANTGSDRNVAYPHEVLDDVIPVVVTDEIKKELKELVLEIGAQHGWSVPPKRNVIAIGH